jgi:hypothetical protein
VQELNRYRKEMLASVAAAIKAKEEASALPAT